MIMKRLPATALLFAFAACSTQEGGAPQVRIELPSSLTSQVGTASKADIFELIADSDGGVVQIAKAGDSELHPRYPGFTEKISVDEKGRTTLSDPTPEIAVDPDLRDALAASPAAGLRTPPRALPTTTKLSSILAGNPVLGYVVITKEDSVEIRPVRDPSVLVTWAAAASEQDRRISRALKQRLADDYQTLADLADAAASGVVTSGQ